LIVFLISEETHHRVAEDAAKKKVGMSVWLVQIEMCMQFIKPGAARSRKRRMIESNTI